MNVGHGDTTIIEYPDDRIGVVDFNRTMELDENSANEIAEELGIDFNKMKNRKNYYKDLYKYYDIALDDPLNYLTENFEDKDIYRYIQTHPHMDHLSGFKSLIEEKEINNFWDTEHEYIEISKFKNNSQEEDWKAYLDYRKDKKLTFYRSNDKISSKSGSYSYDIYVFHPTKDALDEGDNEDNQDPNIFSYIALINYSGFKVVLGGDVLQEYWKDLWGWLDDNDKAKELLKDIHILKASHHGRKSGRCGWDENEKCKRDFLNWMDPDYVVVSVGKKPENCDATEWYRKREDGSSRNVMTTRWHGTICISYDGTTPFEDNGITVETRYDREDKKDFIQEHERLYGDQIYKFKIGAKLDTDSNGDFDEEYINNGRALEKNKFINFYIKDTNIPKLYRVKWRVVNTGKEAREDGNLRGNIEEDKDSLKENKGNFTTFKGTHYMDCFAYKDGKFVAQDRFFINVK